MGLIETFLLGLLQGVGEFLPISSSGHLGIFEHFIEMDESPLTLNVALHAATLCVVLVYFRKKIKNILFPLNKDYLLAIILTSIPTAIIGLSIKKYCESVFENAEISAGLLILNGLYLMFIARLFIKGDEQEVNDSAPKPSHALLIGIAQGIAVFPGLSRSGATIGVAKMLGMSSKSAVEYSLIASLPAIAGAVLLESRKMTEFTNPSGVLLSAFVAMVSGWLAVSALLKIVKSGSFKYWGMYCILAGTAFLGHRFIF